MQLKKQTPDGRRRQQRQGKQHPTHHPTPKPLPREIPDHSLHHRPPGVNKKNITLHVQGDLHRYQHPDGEQPLPQPRLHMTLTKSHQQIGLLQNPTFPETIYQILNRGLTKHAGQAPHNRRKGVAFTKRKYQEQEKQALLRVPNP